MRIRNALCVLIVVWGVGQLDLVTVQAQQITRESETLRNATQVLNDFMTLPNQNIPASMLARAEGLVVIPGMIKVAGIVSARRGRGIAVVRDESRTWRAPVFVTLTGGGVGAQLGVQSTDVVLVFNTRNGVRNLMQGEFTIGGNMSAAAGPVGREASAGTNARLQAEIYSYSRARGLFAGVEVNGSVLQLEGLQTQNYYRAAGLRADGSPLTSNAQLPLEAAQFLSALQSYEAQGAAGGVAGTGPATVVPGPTANQVLPPGSVAAPPAAPRGTVDLQTLEATRLQLAQAAQKLAGMLDESWRTYLSLPSGVFSAQPAMPTAESLRESLQRFNKVAGDARYVRLQKRPEFQQTYQLLQTYLQQILDATAPAGPSASAPPAGGVRSSIR